MSNAADITPGYSFSSGEANVTHMKLNNAASGTINTTFYSGKSSAGTDPNTGFTILLHDTSSDVFKKSTLAAAFFDHSALLASRAAATTPTVADSMLILQSSALKQMTWSNWFFGGTATAAPTNETRFPVLHDGVPSSVTLSNLLGGLTAHSLPTNGDVIPIITENGRAVKGLTLETLIKSQTVATNATNWQSVVWDGASLRTTYETNRIAGLQLATPATNDEVAFLQSGVLKRTSLQGVRSLLGTNVAQDYVLLRYETATTPTNGGPLTSGAWRGRILNTNVVDAAGLATCPPNLVPLSGTTSSGSAVITSVSSTNNLTPGEHLYAVSGLADNTRIVSLDSATQITVSANATASGSRSLYRGSVGLSAGTYRFRASVPGYQVGFHQARLYDLYNARTLGYGTTERSSTADGTQTRSFITGRFTLTDYAVIELQQQVTTTNGTDGGGDDGAFGTEVYAELELWRELQ